MSIGQQQMLMIAKALSSNPSVLILDEPTTLSEQDVANLFRVVRRLKENRTAVVFVTHKMAEIMELTDRVTVPARRQTHHRIQQGRV